MVSIYVFLENHLELNFKFHAQPLPNVHNYPPYPVILPVNCTLLLVLQVIGHNHLGSSFARVTHISPDKDKSLEGFAIKHIAEKAGRWPMHLRPLCEKWRDG
jgi:hypothetical protein